MSDIDYSKIWNYFDILLNKENKTFDDVYKVVDEDTKMEITRASDIVGTVCFGIELIDNFVWISEDSRQEEKKYLDYTIKKYSLLFTYGYPYSYAFIERCKSYGPDVSHDNLIKYLSKNHDGLGWKDYFNSEKKIYGLTDDETAEMIKLNKRQ